jgi:predicted DNA-binding protein (MmcQ/YjbR family)
VFADLVERPDIRPAPYVGRYKWVMLDRLDAVDFAEVKDLISQSYNMVSAKASKRTSRRRARPPKKKKRVQASARSHAKSRRK